MHHSTVESSAWSRAESPPAEVLEVRTARSRADYAEAVSLLRAQKQGSRFATDSLFEISPEWLDEQCGPPTGCVLIAKVRGQTVGCVALQWAGVRTGQIHWLYLHEGDWRYGVEESLLQALVDRATAWGYARLRVRSWQTEPSSRSMYQSSGFRTVEAAGGRGAQWTGLLELELGSRSNARLAMAA